MTFLGKVLSEITAMANVPQRVYRLPLAQDIKFNVLQPGDKKLGHAARVKVFRGSPKTGPNFSVSLDVNPKVVAGKVFVSARDLNLVLEHLKKYRTAYLMLWNDDGMDIDDLRREMDNIDGRSD